MNVGAINLKVLLIAILVVALITGGYFYLQKSKLNSDERTVKPVHVVANNGKFTPSEIDTKIFGDLDLIIKAEDRDYTFSITGYPRFDTQIKKGQTVTIPLYTLGVGDYDFSCGEGCNGVIRVDQKSDEE